MDLEEAAARLYVLAPEEFTAARDAAAREARAAGDAALASQLKSLRRATASAWLVNLLAHEESASLAALLELGERMRAATAAASADLIELGAQRRQRVEDLVRRAIELADREVRPAAREEVVATLEAATADPGSSAAVTSGRLVKPLSYAGFGEVPDAAASVAGTLRVRRPEPPNRRAADVAGARQPPGRPQQRDTQAKHALAEAERESQEAGGAADDAQREYDALSARADRLGQELAAVAERLRALERAHADALKAAAAAERRARQAHLAAERARQRLDQLRRRRAPSA